METGVGLIASPLSHAEARGATNPVTEVNKAHRRARMPEGVLLGHPQIEVYEIVDLSKS